MTEPQAVTVDYSASAEAGKLLSLGSAATLQEGVVPGLGGYASTSFVPRQGDLVQFERAGDENFVVVDRVFKYREDGGLQIRLMIDVPGSRLGAG